MERALLVSLIQDSLSLQTQRLDIFITSLKKYGAKYYSRINAHQRYPYSKKREKGQCFTFNKVTRKIAHYRLGRN